MSIPLIPLATHGSRSSVTCRYRCADACSRHPSSPASAPYFGDVLQAALSRRNVLRAAVVIAAGAAAETRWAAPATAGPRHLGPTFTPVAPNRLDAVVVPDGYQSAVLVRWGDPVLPGADPFDLHGQTGTAQARQFGYNNDYLALTSLGRDRALLLVNHEYTNDELMHPGFIDYASLTVEQVEVSMAACGISLIEIHRSRDSGQWQVASGRRPLNRRLTATTPRFDFSGPAAGTPLLRTTVDPTGRSYRGTLGNCSGGVTPWGTLLSGEENFHFYFDGADSADADEIARLQRYGFDVTTRYPWWSSRWSRVDPAFDIAANPHGPNAFGWVVELDPTDPSVTPRKLTALGRFKHEAANTVLSRDQRAVVYMGDDDRFEYVYKFVSRRTVCPGTDGAARRRNRAVLDDGSLYVARFDASSADEIDGTGHLPGDGKFDGRGVWLPLVRDGRSAVPGMTVDEVLVLTRQAADAVGATRMDRPEDIEISPRTGRVYIALTNNTYRGGAGRPAPDEANPRTNNRHGHVLEIEEDHGDHASEAFYWNLMLVCGDPADPSTYFAGYDKSRVSPISAPDNLAFDADDTLWIATDGNALGSNDGLFAVPASGPERGNVRQFLTVPLGAEACGPVISDDRRTVFLAVQHPGEIDGSTIDDPASRWPDGNFPRPSVICVWRPDGRPIGS